MKIICILQNAWGDRDLPTVFIPNPHNKSARTIQKMIGEDNQAFFCNTTNEMTITAKGKPKPTYEHFEKVILKLGKFDMILVCGNQAKETVNRYLDTITALNRPMIFVPHPASRSLSNVQIEIINKTVNENRKSIGQLDTPA